MITRKCFAKFILELRNSNFNLDIEIIKKTYLPLQFASAGFSNSHFHYLLLHPVNLASQHHSCESWKTRKEKLGNHIKHSKSPSLTSERSTNLAHTKQSIISNWDLKLHLLKASPLIIVIVVLWKILASRKAYCLKNVLYLRLKQIPTIKQITVKHWSIFYNTML